MPHIHFDALYHDDFENVKVNFKTLDKCSRDEKKMVRPDVLGENGLDIPDIIRITNHSDILRSLKSIIYYYQRRDPASILIQKSLAVEMLYKIIMGLESLNNRFISTHNFELDNVLSYILEHFKERISIEDLAKKCCLSTHHFERLFKGKYKVTPSRYIIRHRIEKAKEIMLYSKMSISSISEEVGYGSIHSFSKAFKRIEGISPSEYIKRIK
jgi:AraC-like DNA-binding protein